MPVLENGAATDFYFAVQTTSTRDLKVDKRSNPTAGKEVFLKYNRW